MKKPGRRHGRPGLWSSAATPFLQPFDAVMQIGEVLPAEGLEQHDEIYRQHWLKIGKLVAEK